MRDTTLAYAAGLLDGEGYVAILQLRPLPPYRTSRFTMKVQIGMTHQPTILWLQETFGFNVFVKQPTEATNRRNTASIADLQSVRAAEFLKQIQPWVRTKSEQVALAIHFQETFNDWRATMPRMKGQPRIPDHEVARRQTLYEKMRTLNGRMKGPQ